MRQGLIGLGMIAATLALIFVATRAHAQDYSQPPPSGWYGLFKIPLIACDTKEQIQQIAAAGIEDDKKMADKLMEFHAVTDQYNQPTCVYGLGTSTVAVGESIPLEDVNVSGKKTKAWAVHVGTRNAEWWLLYVSPEEQLVGTPT